MSLTIGRKCVTVGVGSEVSFAQAMLRMAQLLPLPVGSQLLLQYRVCLHTTMKTTADSVCQPQLDVFLYKNCMVKVPLPSNGNPD